MYRCFWFSGVVSLAAAVVFVKFMVRAYEETQVEMFPDVACDDAFLCYGSGFLCVREPLPTIAHIVR